MAAYEELSGIYERTAWYSDAGDYVIGFLEDGTTVKGHVEPGEPQSGIAYRFFGGWREGNRGRFFYFACLVKDLPHSREAVVQYLLKTLRGHNTGIGHAIAHRLYDAYQADAVRMLRMNPNEVAKRLKLKIDKLRVASSILTANWRTENTMIELTGLLYGKGFPSATIKDCFKLWKSRAPSLIRRDAFLMMTNKIKGAGFLRCDRLYIENNGDPSKLKRQFLCAWHALHEDSTGNTWHHPSVCFEAIKSKVCGSNPDPIRALRLGRRSGWLAVHRENGNTWIADARKAANEQSVAESVAQRLNLDARWPEINASQLTDHQRTALRKALIGRIGILAGTPGTGKTFTAAAVVQAVLKEYGPGAIEICAPTGKAAVRITESMANYGIRGLVGKTIHRTLVVRSNGHGGEWEFLYGNNEKLPVRFVIVDEVSMCDTDLMKSLLAACDPETHILLIGDPYQLPPVGHGAPLRDMIKAGVPYGELQEIKRNDGLIVRACQSIKDGKHFSTCRQFVQDSPRDNLLSVPTSSTAQVFAELAKIIDAVKKAGKRDPIEDIQILTPLNDKSDVSRKKLNPYLQRLLNPDGQTAKQNRFRVNDKVICLKNGMYPGAPDDDGEKVNQPIFNGEQGKVTAVDPLWTEMAFPETTGTRYVRIPENSEWRECFDLSYAITIHKSQGSEFPVVIVIADEAAGRVASRELWYTAISRASGKCIILGSLGVIQKQCRKQILSLRRTFLAEKIRQYTEQ